MTPTDVFISERPVGGGAPCFIIAEAGVNHNGDPELARRMVQAARDCGADAVKFQTFKADKLVTASAPKAAYQKRSTNPEESQLEMLRRLELSPQAHRDLLAFSRHLGLQFLSSPFDEESADFLFELGLPAFKVGSGELTNLPLLEHIARKGKPVLLSTGMSTLGEVETALRAIAAAQGSPLPFGEKIALLHCVTNYPADPAEINLRAMHTLNTAFNLPAGYSDHTPGIEVPLAAAALGACIIEKHFTLDRSLPGPDHKASLEPAEFEAMVRGIRMVESALGDGCKLPTASELPNAAVARKSITAGRNIHAGEVLCAADLAIRRPGTGLPPAFVPHLLGRCAARDIPAGSLISLDMLC